ncbi:hypothetical protein [Paraburkholderia humisilvae]|nr:hypothetical protein [Paraburkholderia humisilvae]
MLRTVALIVVLTSLASSALAGNHDAAIRNRPEATLSGVHHMPSPAKRHRKMVARHGLRKTPARKPGHGKARTHHMPRIVAPEENILRVSADKADVKVTR